LIHLILCLTWLAFGVYVLLAQESLQAIGITRPLNFAILAGILGTYDLLRWGLWMRSRRRGRAPVKPIPAKLAGQVIHPEFDFSDNNKRDE
jgi:hypothetical protein